MTDLYGNSLQVGDRVVFKYTPYRESVYLRIATIESFKQDRSGTYRAILKDVQFLPIDGTFASAKWRYCQDLVKISC